MIPGKVTENRKRAISVSFITGSGQIDDLPDAGNGLIDYDSRFIDFVQADPVIAEQLLCLSGER